MPLLLQPPEVQFCDANGHPYAMGTVETYAPGTSTPKSTWQDHNGSALNTNPIVLDAAGRAIIFGDGDYRFVLKDAAGNLIYDQWTSSIVSIAMQPVVAAPTIAEAQRLLGIGDLSAETAARIAGDAALGTRIDNEVSRATAAETSLRNDLNSEIARAEAAEAHLQSEIDAMGAAGPTAYVQIYTAHQQVTTLTITVPAGKNVKVTCNPVTGSTDVSGTTWLASGTLNRDGTLLGNYGYTVPADTQPSTPPPNFPAGPIDAPGSGSHTYTVNFFVHPDVTAATGISGWPATFAGNANCYILAELI